MPLAVAHGYQRHNVALADDWDEQEPLQRSFWEWFWGKPPEEEFQSAGLVHYLLDGPYEEIKKTKLVVVFRFSQFFQATTLDFNMVIKKVSFS